MAPEPYALAERLKENDIEAEAAMTGDYMLIVSEADLDTPVRRFLHESHYTEGTPRAATNPGDGYVAFRPTDRYPPDTQ